jgi:DNA repair protein RadA/Sms
MAKKSTVYVCQECGAHSPQYMGRCPECGEWNSLVEEMVSPQEKEQLSKKVDSAEMVSVDQVEANKTKRINTGIVELDRVLGGGPPEKDAGIVPGSVVLFSGEPGIGKSTLLTQLAVELTKTEEPLNVIYVCGEESPEQIKLRLNRLLPEDNSKLDKLKLLPETNVDAVIKTLNSLKAKGKNGSNILLIVDSIQTLHTEDLSGVAGSISQLRECTKRLIKLAKTKQVPTFLVGHVTKKGNIAGPKTIEHAIDTVLYLEGERSSNLRLLRSVKNRFGPTDEVGVFKMTDSGLKQVVDPSFLGQDKEFSGKPGSAYSVVFEGTRPMMVEIQALVSKSFTPVPKRVINGLDRRRAEMLIAIVQKYLNLKLWEYDVFLNVTGGLRIKEPAVDLAVCAAIYSSYRNKSLPNKSAWVGEVSLLGGINRVTQIKKRRKQAKAVGFDQIYTRSEIKKIIQLKDRVK